MNIVLFIVRDRLCNSCIISTLLGKSKKAVGSSKKIRGVSCANTFRGGKKIEELINIENDYFHLSAVLIKNRTFELEISANRQKKRQIKINNVP